MGQTSNYGFPQWDSREGPGRETLNQRFQESDQAIQAAMDALTDQVAEKGAFTAGSYTGTGVASRTVVLGFRPKAVVVERQDGGRITNNPCGGMAVEGFPCYYSKTGGGISVTQEGFLVNAAETSQTNLIGTTYHYMAFRQ